jgi:hypothetical protein
MPELGSAFARVEGFYMAQKNCLVYVYKFNRKEKKCANKEVRGNEEKTRITNNNQMYLFFFYTAEYKRDMYLSFPILLEA